MVIVFNIIKYIYEEILLLIKTKCNKIFHTLVVFSLVMATTAVIISIGIVYMGVESTFVSTILDSSDITARFFYSIFSRNIISCI